MSQSENFIKIRPYFGLVILLILFIPMLVFHVIERLINGLVLRRKFKSIKGDVAVVTGAGHGLGRCIAVELAKRGCHVAIVDINLEGAKETETILSSNFEVKCKAYKVDVTNYGDILKLNDNISKDLGVATILFNNAGILTSSTIGSPSEEEIQRMINVNLTSHFLMNRVFLENMKKQRKGHIVSVGSIAGFFPLIYHSLYCATKFGVRGMMRSFRLELSANDFGDIHATLVMPFFLSTNEKVNDYVQSSNIAQVYPLISGEKAAQETVKSMLKNEVEVIIPNIFSSSCRIYDLLPATCQDKLQYVMNKVVFKGFQEAYEQHLKKIDYDTT